MTPSDIMLEDLVRGAFIQEMQDSELSGYGDFSDDSLMQNTLAGLEDGSIEPISAADFDARFIDLMNTGQLDGFFKKLKKKLKKVVRKLPTRRVLKSVKKRVKRVARKIKPHLKKIAAVAVVAAGGYAAAPYLKGLFAAAKSKFITGAGKKVFLKKALDKAIREKAPVAVQRQIAKRWADASKQEMAEQQNAQRQGSDALSRYLAQARNEAGRAAWENQPTVSPQNIRDRARIEATNKLRSIGVNVDSPQGQRMLDQMIKETQAQKGMPTGDAPDLAKLAIPAAILAVGAMA